MRLRYNRGAISDLDAILAYLSELDPRVAARQISKFEAAARLIAQYPYIGKETGREALRLHVVGQYLMLYEVAADVVTVHYIRHGARKQPWDTD